MKQGRAQRSMLQRTSLEVQRLRLHASTEGGTGFIPGGGTKIPKKGKKEEECSILSPGKGSKSLLINTDTFLWPLRNMNDT